MLIYIIIPKHKYSLKLIEGLPMLCLCLETEPERTENSASPEN